MLIAINKIALYLFILLIVLSVAHTTHQSHEEDAAESEREEDSGEEDIAMHNEPSEIEQPTSHYDYEEDHYYKPRKYMKKIKSVMKRKRKRKRKHHYPESEPITTPMTTTLLPTPTTVSHMPGTCAGRAKLPCSYAESNLEDLKDLLETDKKGTVNQTERGSWWGQNARSQESVFAANFLKETICKEVINHLDPTIAKSKPKLKRLRRSTQRCLEKNTNSAPGTLRICGECSVVTDLGVQWSPRYVNEVVCNGDESSFCFGEEGNCVQNSITILVETHHFGITSFASYNMRTGCSCELYPGSVLLDLNT